MRIKRRKEPRTEAQEEMPAERGERREVTRMEEKKLAAQVRHSFNSKMQCQKKCFKVFTLWHLFLLKKGLFANISSIDTQQFNNHTSRVYSVSVTLIFQGSMLKHPKLNFSSNINLSIYYSQISSQNFKCSIETSIRTLNICISWQM